MRIWNCSGKPKDGDSYKSGSKNHLDMNYSDNQWTPAELEFLQAHYGTMPTREISAWLYRHTVQGIYQKASSIGLKRRVPQPKKKKPVRPKASPKAIGEEGHPGPQEKWKPADYGPYDPSCHCCECTHYCAGEYKCRCWHVKGRHGDYKYVRPKDPSCRYFIPLTASTSSGESY